MAWIVAYIRGSLASRNFMTDIISAEASRSSEPNACVNAPARSLQPQVKIAWRIASRVAVQLCDLFRSVQRHREGDGAVEGRPALKFRVQKVPRTATQFPDALVLLPPVPGGGVRGLDKEIA